jgi:hypothetical protein
MNITMFRSGNQTFVNAECIKGYSFNSAVAGVESAHFHAMAATGSSFASAGAAA